MREPAPHPASPRRYFLKTVAGSVTLPSLASLAGGTRAAESVVQSTPLQATQGAGIGARRFVAIGNLLGFQTKDFFPEASGRDYETTTLLKPLVDNREHITIYRGLDHGIRGGHFAVHTFLSGVLHHESKHRLQRNVTIDQFIADEIGKQTRFASLTAGCEGGIHGGCQMSWTKSGVRVPPITGPAELFAKLFIEESPERHQQRVRANALQASILDAVRGEANSLASRVNSEDKQKLDEYFTSIRDVEKRLEARQQWADQPKPDAPFEQPANTNTVDDLPMMYELIALALQTDLTRVATLEIGGSFLPQNLGINDSYHSLSHHGNKQESIDHLITLETYQLTQFSKFLNRLASIQDGDQSLLDSTAVLFGSGMGNANSHTNHDLPIVLAGGGYGRGEFKKVEGQVPLCNLFLDIAHRMGVHAPAFGTSTGTFA